MPLNEFILRIIVSIRLCLTFALLFLASLAYAEDMLLTDHPLAGKIWGMNSRSYIDEATLLARVNTAARRMTTRSTMRGKRGGFGLNSR